MVDRELVRQLEEHLIGKRDVHTAAAVWAPNGKVSYTLLNKLLAESLHTCTGYATRVPSEEKTKMLTWQSQIVWPVSESGQEHEIEHFLSLPVPTDLDNLCHLCA
jgi:hypothetical protein